MWISWWISGHCLFQEENSWCSHHNWTKSILNILMWEKTILCRRPKWACVPMKSHFSPQNSPRLIHRLFFFLLLAQTKVPQKAWWQWWIQDTAQPVTEPSPWSLLSFGFSQRWLLPQPQPWLRWGQAWTCTSTLPPAPEAFSTDPVSPPRTLAK